MRPVPALVTIALLTFPASVSTTNLHFSLLRSVPSKDQKLDVPPPRLQLWFSQAPAAVVSQITLKREALGIPLSKTVVDDKEKSMYADPVKPLETGAYTLTWRAAGDDGHLLSGEVKFTVERKGSP
jgi:methionine-rich copper-binding protein CopC